MIAQPSLFDPPPPARIKAGSQCDRTLRYIREHGSISDIEAFTKLRIRRLSARIYDLRSAGYDIQSTTEAHDGGTHSRYSLRQAKAS